MGPQKFHTIPCISPKRENRVRTSHLLPYTLLFTGWLFASVWEGTRSGSLSASVLELAPIAAFCVSVQFKIRLQWVYSSGKWAAHWDAVDLTNKNTQTPSVSVSGVYCARANGNSLLCGTVVAGSPFWLVRRISLSGAVATTAESQWSRFTVRRSGCK